MMVEVILLIIGFFMIIKASDVLVDSASSLAIKFKVPKMLVALTIVSFGTCAPEVAISFNSVAAKNGTMAFANVVGSCIVNVFLIIGLAALTKNIKVKHATVKKEMPILVLITTCFCILMLDSTFNPNTHNVFSRADGIILILLFFMFIAYLIQLFRDSKLKSEKKEKEKEVKPKYDSIIISIILLVLSTILIVLSSDLIVENATKIAKLLHISEKVITMTAIVIGTSLPELFMTVSSARKGEFEMTIGNIIGTNIFNICIVLGLPVAIYGDIQLLSFTIVDILAVFLSSFDLFLFARSERTVSKQEGIIMLLIFAVYYVYVLF